MPHVVAPVPDRDDAFFWTGVGNAELLARACSQCGRIQHPPTPMCPNCGCLTWQEQALSGNGAVSSWIISRHPSQSDEAVRIVAVIDLAEGIRLVSNLQDVNIEDIRNDMQVEVVFVETDGVKLPHFRPAKSVS